MKNVIRIFFVLFCLFLMLSPLSAVAQESEAASGGGNLPLPLSSSAISIVRPTRAAFTSVALAGSRLVAVGEHGVVILSDDNGGTWRQASSVPVSVMLTSVKFVSAQLGWAVGNLGVVLRTDDGGDHWVRQLDGLMAAQIEQRSEEAAVAGMAATDATKHRLRLARRLVTDGPDKPFLDLMVLDAQHLLTIGAYGLAFHSDDGGQSWTSWMDRINDPDQLHLYEALSAQNSLLIFGEQGTLRRSVDGGQHFEMLTSPYQGTFFGALKLADGRVLAYGLRGNAYVSSDVTKGWTQVPTGVDASLNGAVQLPDGTIVVAEQAGVLISRDDAKSFEPFLPLDGVPLNMCVRAADGSLVFVGLVGVIRLPGMAFAARPPVGAG